MSKPTAIQRARRKWEEKHVRLSARVSPALYARIAASKGNDTWEEWLARAVDAIARSR